MAVAAAIEEPAFDGRHFRQGSVVSSRQPSIHSQQGLSRHASRRSKRSSMGSGSGYAVINTAADVTMGVGSSPLGAHSPAPPHQQVERRLSQYSDNDVEAVVAKAMEEVSRRPSNASSYHRRISPQMSLTVPPGSTAANMQPSPSHLAPPSDAELQAQRRFSDVNAAVDRHNSRRAARRAQSMHHRGRRRGGQGGAGAPPGPGRRNSSDYLTVTSLQVPGMMALGAPPLSPGGLAPAPAMPLHHTLSAPSPSRQIHPPAPPQH